MADTDFLPYEQTKHEELPSEEIQRRLRERAELAAAIKDMPRGVPRIRGEGSALEEEPTAAPAVVSIRERLAAQRRERGEPEEPVAGEAQPAQERPAFTGREQRRPLNADPAKLAELVAAAQRAEEEARTAEELAESARTEADSARRELDAYLEESGLAG